MRQFNLIGGLEKYLIIFMMGFSALFYQNCANQFDPIDGSYGLSSFNLPPADASKGEVNLTWDLTTTNTDGSPASIRGYRIYVDVLAQNDSIISSSLIDENTIGNVTGYQLKGLVPGQKYHFGLTAISVNYTESDIAELNYLAP